MPFTELFNRWFDFIYFFCILNACLACMEVWFFSRFSNQKVKWYYFVSYILIIYLLASIEISIRAAFPLSTLMELAALFLFGWLALKCAPAMSATAAILAICIMQVAIILPFHARQEMLY